MVSAFYQDKKKRKKRRSNIWEGCIMLHLRIMPKNQNKRKINATANVFSEARMRLFSSLWLYAQHRVNCHKPPRKLCLCATHTHAHRYYAMHYTRHKVKLINLIMGHEPNDMILIASPEICCFDYLLVNATTTMNTAPLPFLLPSAAEMKILVQAG